MSAFNIVKVSSSVSKVQEIAIVSFDTEDGGRVRVTVEPENLRTIIDELRQTATRLEGFAEWWGS